MHRRKWFPLQYSRNSINDILIRLINMRLKAKVDMKNSTLTAVSCKYNVGSSHTYMNHKACEPSSNMHPCDLKVGGESIRIFRREMKIGGWGGAPHLPLHGPSYVCVTKVKEWGKSLFYSWYCCVIAVTARVRFLIVNCFCKEMGVLGLVRGLLGVYRLSENKTVLGYPGNHSLW
jgi:hypothetical protein